MKKLEQRCAAFGAAVLRVIGDGMSVDRGSLCEYAAELGLLSGEGRAAEVAPSDAELERVFYDSFRRVKS